MTSQTRILLDRFEEEAREAIAEEALDNAKAAVVAEYFNKFHKFELLDTVFTEFLQTNSYRGTRYDLEGLLLIKARRFFQFQHLSIGTVSTFDGHDFDWVNIKLCNDGFVYMKEAGTHVQRHMAPGSPRSTSPTSPASVQQFSRSTPG